MAHMYSAESDGGDAGCVSLYDRMIGWENYVEGLHWKVGKLWRDVKNHSRMTRELGCRAGYALLVIPNVVTSVASAVIGLGYGACAMVKGGTDEDLNERAYHLLHLHRRCISQIYEPIVQGCNPSQILDDTAARNSIGFRSNESFIPQPVNCKGQYNGILAGEVLKYGEELADSCLRSDSTFIKYVASRTIYLITIPLVVIARVVDFAIGLLAAFFSLLTLGLLGRPTALAYQGLQITGVVNDVFTLLLQTINPWADLPDR